VWCAPNVIEVRDGELLDTIEQAVKERSIDNAAIVTLIGAVDSFTLSTMPANDTTRRSGGREPSDP
jgi:hypothetical protein